VGVSDLAAGAAAVLDCIRPTNPIVMSATMTANVSAHAM